MTASVATGLERSATAGANGDPIERRKAPYRQLQFGGTVGGAIRRNHSFYFLTAERLRVRANNFVNIDDTTVEILRRANFIVELGHVAYRLFRPSRS